MAFTPENRFQFPDEDTDFVPSVIFPVALKLGTQTRQLAGDIVMAVHKMYKTNIHRLPYLQSLLRQITFWKRRHGDGVMRAAQQPIWHPLHPLPPFYMVASSPQATTRLCKCGCDAGFPCLLPGPVQQPAASVLCSATTKPQSPGTIPLPIPQLPSPLS